MASSFDAVSEKIAKKPHVAKMLNRLLGRGYGRKLISAEKGQGNRTKTIVRFAYLLRK